LKENKFSEYAKLVFSGQFSKLYLISLLAGYARHILVRWVKKLEFTLVVKPIFFIVQIAILLMSWICDLFSDISKGSSADRSEVVAGNGKVAVIIPNYKGETFLDKLLISLKKQTYKNVEIVVVDNDSRDGSEDIVHKFPDVRWVPMGKNKGFAAAVNRGAEEASNAEFFALLNNDTEVEPEWAEQQVKTLQANPNIGMVGARIYQKGFNHLINIHAHIIGSDLRCYNLGAGQEDKGQFDEPIPVIGVSGCSMMIRAKAFYEVGGFDESFFLCYEDIDFSMRIFWLGWDCYVVPKAICYHVSNASLETGSSTHIRNILLNDMLWVVKNMPSKFMFMEHMFFLTAVLRSEELRLFFTWQGWNIVLWRLMGFCNVAKILKKRKQINRTRRRPLDSISLYIKPLQEVNPARLYQVDIAERYLIPSTKGQLVKNRHQLFPDKLEGSENFVAPADLSLGALTLNDDPQIHFRIDADSRSFKRINLDMTSDQVSWGQFFAFCRTKSGFIYFLRSNHFRVFAGRYVNTFEINERFFSDNQTAIRDIFGLWRQDMYQLRFDPCEVAGVKIVIHSLEIS
jgi:GT2 family glycosyltransferase